ncbi:Endoribonuclease L-PSP/chorismate mutase-like protein [Aspergillus novoparasiticus]|uniref:Endoribonuclease L-PSP/chorismate mutase-like protein n=1 Tax=Aspergillus novoparasiticus TaxID=986946 RepID=A0A5N6EK36_9EURO|nr:Endoribonuclease L-PSP/chorismate mutase-like protein [Aspergillus novoparasiticus]
MLRISSRVLSTRIAHSQLLSSPTSSFYRILRPQLPIQIVTMSGMTPISAAGACPPAGPYSQAVRANGQIFVSGQIPADASGNLVTGNIGDQTQACCNNIKAIVDAAGSSVDKIVKVNVFLTDMANFAEMNATYEKFFTHKPARSCVAVAQLPKGVPVEIECIALA